MNATTFRPYQAGDVDKMTDLIRSRTETDRLDFPNQNDLNEIFADPAMAGHSALWLDQAGAPQAYAFMIFEDSFAGLVFEGREETPALLESLIAWGCARWQDTYHGKSDGLYTGAGQHQETRGAALEKAGFIRLEEEVIAYARDLGEPVPAPAFPPGYTLRALRGADEAAAWVDLHRAAFGTRNMTVEYKCAMLALPGYDPELDLLAVAPDGSLAAYVVGTFERASQEAGRLAVGFTDPVATHPAHQNRGLARALLLHCLALLRQRGADVARLSTASDNLAMQAAARSVGYRELKRSQRWMLPVS